MKEDSFSIVCETTFNNYWVLHKVISNPACQKLWNVHLFLHTLVRGGIFSFRLLVNSALIIKIVLEFLEGGVGGLALQLALQIAYQSAFVD